jgi:hypothetical protein
MLAAVMSVLHIGTWIFQEAIAQLKRLWET